MRYLCAPRKGFGLNCRRAGSGGYANACIGFECCVKYQLPVGLWAPDLGRGGGKYRYGLTQGDWQGGEDGVGLIVKNLEGCGVRHNRSSHSIYPVVYAGFLVDGNLS